MLGIYQYFRELKSVLLKDTTWLSWGSNPEPLAQESDALPLSHHGSSIHRVWGACTMYEMETYPNLSSNTHVSWPIAIKKISYWAGKRSPRLQSINIYKNI